jgi:hypothetical protein
MALGALRASSSRSPPSWHVGQTEQLAADTAMPSTIPPRRINRTHGEKRFDRLGDLRRIGVRARVAGIWNEVQRRLRFTPRPQAAA